MPGQLAFGAVELFAAFRNSKGAPRRLWIEIEILISLS